MTRSELVQRERTEIMRIARSYGAHDLRLFGSVARNQDSSDSDIDFLVRLDPGRSLLDLVALKQDLEDLLGCSVDVVTEDALSPFIRDEVLREASYL